jgi:hypothetical protein
VKRIKFVTAILGLALIGTQVYGSSLESQQSAAALAWVSSAPSDSVEFYYGVGDGKSITEAKNNALADISSRISSTVNGSFSSSVSATRLGDNEEVALKVRQDVVTKSKEVEYNNVEVQESANENGVWHVLVKVDRNLLAQTYIDKLTKVDDQLKNEWDIFASASAFEKLKLSDNINKLLNQTDSMFAIIKVVQPSFDDSKYASRYTMYTKEMRNAQNALVFNIKADDNSQTLAQLVRSQLSMANYKFSDSSYNVLLKIKTTAVQQKIDSANPQFAAMIWALRTTVIEAYDKQGMRVSNAVVKTKSGSPDGFADAINRTKKYEEIISREGIVSFLTNGNQKK